MPQPEQTRRRPDLPPWQQPDSVGIVETKRFSLRLASRSCGAVGPRLQWTLETDYNGLCFHVCQAFFPRTSAWETLKKALRGAYDESVWDHLAGTKSTPFEAGEHGQVGVKVIDDRGDELLVVKSLEEAE